MNASSAIPLNPAITPKASVAEMESRLRQALAPAELQLQDDSHQHAGHAGAREGGHYSLLIVSERFTGLNRVARHRLVYHSLGELMQRGIHALAIDARAPGER
ncbi:BolA family transcriptional regulator [Paucibacter sp. KBW04]|uniref:BolA family protein n=1 Tax=Paucibacter sp. KBW04 TaxID=2153361 RepID=UPI000F57F0BD|nr:BolA family protein [Paucibacter sp. KBW04]RQO57306.1 BolA family transcriptional regulator [Paucibacter sp. KBW04]